MTTTDRTIDGVAKTIAEVLEKKKYSIDYYQREYKWEAKQIAELVSDLTTKFLTLYEPAHAPSEVAKYPGYYLGSIIISQKGAQPFVVDGQQRLTGIIDAFRAHPRHTPGGGHPDTAIAAQQGGRRIGAAVGLGTDQAIALAKHLNMQPLGAALGDGAGVLLLDAEHAAVRGQPEGPLLIGHHLKQFIDR